ncbi:hypothetical protein GCM10023205_15020 [Yinghuangia aomiensis]|uniref:Uncharacterized protein n=1 Tax=Yinghuangia aomiensis TaxID=676205 RepID=A0ABP9GVN0_9ACTN
MIINGLTLVHFRLPGFPGFPAFPGRPGAPDLPDARIRPSSPPRAAGPPPDGRGRAGRSAVRLSLTDRAPRRAGRSGLAVGSDGRVVRRSG